MSCPFSLSAAAKSLQSCPTLCDPIDGSPPGSPVYGIFQARVLEWGAIAFSLSSTCNKHCTFLHHNPCQLMGFAVPL